MKNKSITLFAVLLLATSMVSTAQNLNWRSMNDAQAHLLNVHMAWDYGSTIGVGYGYKWNAGFPLVTNVELSWPFGADVFDDFKIKLGGQAELLKFGHLSASVKAYGVFRRNETEFARLLNFGSEFSGLCGYYESNWYAAAEFGFDKAVDTHVKHSPIMREYNPSVKDGWYIPTGGNFFYGIQFGYSLKRYDVTLKIGKTMAQDLKTTPLVPYYLQVGFNRSF